MDSAVYLSHPPTNLSAVPQNHLIENEASGYYPFEFSSHGPWVDVDVEPLATDPFTTEYWPMNETFLVRHDTEDRPFSKDYPVLASPNMLPDTPPDTPPATKPSAPKPTRARNRQKPPVKRKAHNEIEQKYRNTVNEAIRGLQSVVPQISTRKNADSDNPQMTKAAILNSATAYIKQLEQEREKLLEENRFFRDVMMRNNGCQERDLF